MGTVIPPDDFEIDPTKNYRVTTLWFLTPIVEACDVQPPIRDATAIFLGAVIIAWLDAGFECTYNILIAPPGLNIVERIIEMVEV